MRKFRESIRGFTRRELAEEKSNLERMLQNIDRSFRIDTTVFEKGLLEGEIYSHVYRELFQYLRDLTGKDTLSQVLKEVAQIDTTLTEEANKGLRGTFVYWYRLKEGWKEKIREFLLGLQEELNTAIAEIEEEIQRRREEKERRRRRFEIVEVVRKQEPTKEKDGYWEGVLRTETGEEVRMVARNVFDFGYYCYPKRLEGTTKIFKKEEWSQLEREAERWLTEFPPISPSIRM